MRKFWWISLIVVGFAVSRSLPSQAAPEMPRSPSMDSDLLCPGGPSGWLMASLQPIVEDGSESRVSAFQLRITASKGNARVRYAIERVGDLGQSLAEPVVSDIVTVAEPGDMVTAVPLVDMPDGYYLVRATVVGVAADDEGSYIAEAHARVMNGAHVSMSPADWLRNSNANLAIP